MALATRCLKEFWARFLVLNITSENPKEFLSNNKQDLMFPNIRRYLRRKLPTGTSRDLLSVLSSFNHLCFCLL